MEIPVEIILVIGAIIAVALVIVATKNKATPKTMERMFRDYEYFTDRCNDTVRDINEVIDRVKEKVFVSVSDRDDAESLIKAYNHQYNELAIAHEKVGFYLGKRNVKYYNHFRKKAAGILSRMLRIYEDLLKVEVYAQTKEAFDSMHGTYQQQQANDGDDSYGSDAYNDQYKEPFERENREEKKQKTKEPIAERPMPLDVFFAGCNTAEDVERRYRSLAKIYHPDMPTGDKETFQQLQEEYERRKTTK